ncbi:MAG: class I SAM-dependent methyltransferase [Desulfarculaceae bacterium]|nr:class I SAM-dependent methyltransferase [Desulfarculaceae bacterium]
MSFAGGKIGAILHLIETYLAVLPTVLYRMTLSAFFDPKGCQKFVHSVLDNLDLTTDDRVLKTTTMSEIFKTDLPDELNVTIYSKAQPGVTNNINEINTLAFLVKTIKPNRIFEFGTHVGRTTRMFAQLTSSDAKITTLDLPREMVAHDIGSAFYSSAEASKIRQVHSDSMSYNYTPYYDKCDFVWVDACHDFEYVMFDTNEALKMCKQGGHIGWHDYRHTAWWSGVTRAVRKTASKKGLKIMHIRGTTIALLRKV